MKTVFAGAFALALAGSVVALAQSGPRRDGNWDITIETEMAGMPQGMSMPPMHTTQCITKEQAADPQHSIPQRPAGRGGPAPDCKISDYKTEGNKVSWSMQCEGAQAMSGTGEFVYGADSYTGAMKMNMAGRGGQPMAVTMKYTGKRLGDCTK